jgi:N-acylglucosamine 2-epimerase
MREIDDNPKYEEMIQKSMNTIFTEFVKEDKKALFETVSSEGEFIDTPEGRFINPGHSMETAWFMMKEAVLKKDKKAMETSIKITEWSLERGWDNEQGGIFYFLDVFNKPVLSLEWDMKLFWVHCEAMIALTYSYLYTKDEKYLEWFEKIFEYVCEHYQDPGHPEWYGHLHRDGTPISHIKGSDWKGPFHNVRAFMVLSQLFDKLRNGEELEF